MFPYVSINSNVKYLETIYIVTFYIFLKNFIFSKILKANSINIHNKVVYINLKFKLDIFYIYKVYYQKNLKRKFQTNVTFESINN